MEKAHYFIYGVLIGVILVLGVLLVTHTPELAFAQTASDAAGMAAVTGYGGSGQNTSSWIWILDPSTKHLACYEATGGKSIRPIGVRNITWDMLVPLEAEGDAIKSVEQVKKGAEAYENAHKKQEEGTKEPKKK